VFCACPCSPVRPWVGGKSPKHSLVQCDYFRQVDFLWAGPWSQHLSSFPSLVFVVDAVCDSCCSPPRFYSHSLWASLGRKLGAGWGSVEESTLPVIGRPRRAEVGTQWSEHGVVATGEHEWSLGGLCVEGHIRFLCGPDVMEQDGQLASNGNHGLVLGLFTAAFSQMKTSSRSDESFPCGRRIWFAHSISRLRR